jgi:hypothetical protein
MIEAAFLSSLILSETKRSTEWPMPLEKDALSAGTQSRCP